MDMLSKHEQIRSFAEFFTCPKEILNEKLHFDEGIQE